MIILLQSPLDRTPFLKNIDHTEKYCKMTNYKYLISNKISNDKYQKIRFGRKNSKIRGEYN